MIKLVIFDWDGTLADSISDIIICKKVIACKYDLPIPSSAAIKRVLGMKFEIAMKQLFPLATKQCFNELCDDFRLRMQNHFNAKLFPCAISTLNKLKNEGLKLAIASSKSKDELALCLKYHNISKTFDIVCCADEYISKPNPLILERIMEKLKIKKENTIMVGDSTVDIKCAKNAGVAAVAITHGAHSETELKNSFPDAIIHHLSELINLIEAKSN